MSPTTNGIDMSKVTHAATVDIRDVLAPATNKVARSMPMPGFEDIFVDIVDYILKITYWIWHEKKVELCKDYYSDDCKFHTMAGTVVVTGEQVAANTWKTLEAFPDRTLDGENVVWSLEEESSTAAATTTYYSSHLIVSRMTNDGVSEWGPPTHKRARIRTIADCVCVENKIVEEWLMRDNALLVKMMGYDLQALATEEAQKDLHNNKNNILDILKRERQRVQENCISKLPATPTKAAGSVLGDHVTNPSAFVHQLFLKLWIEQDHNQLSTFYDYRVSAHLTAGRELYGTAELKGYLQQFQAGLSDVFLSMDHVASIPYLGDDAIDVAVRWTLTAKHADGSIILGEATNAPIYILASSHFRIIRGRVREEWTVFDELALLKQVATQRLLNKLGLN